MKIDVELIIYICTTIITISSALAIIVKCINKVIDKTVSASIENYLKNNPSPTKESLDELNTIVKDYISKQRTINENIQQGLLAVIRSQINSAHDKYMKLGYIGAHTLYVIEQLYDSYESLGGNSFTKKQIEDLRTLDVRSAELVNK